MRWRPPGDGEWGLFYDAIDGFEFAWGRTNLITIYTTEIVDPPADGSSLAYHLSSIDETTVAPPGTAFDLELDLGRLGNDAVNLVDLDEGTLQDGRDFACATPEVCDALATAIHETRSATLHFEYADPIDEALWLASVELR
jgi:hypothetical protein